VKNVEITGTQLPVALHYKKADMLNKIKGGINNLDKVITKVITYVIILITISRL